MSWADGAYTALRQAFASTEHSLTLTKLATLGPSTHSELFTLIVDDSLAKVRHAMSGKTACTRRRDGDGEPAPISTLLVPSTYGCSRQNVYVRTTTVIPSWRWCVTSTARSDKSQCATRIADRYKDGD